MAKNLEIERKFLLKKVPNFPVKGVGKKWDCYDIYQFYYPETKDKWTRYRLKVFNGYSLGDRKEEYYKTIKKKISDGVYEEDETKITKEQFYALWRDKKSKKLIEKTRYWYKENNLVWEIDLYKGMKLVTLEVELKDIKQKIKIPKLINDCIITEVTSIKGFSNFSLSELIKRNKK